AEAALSSTDSPSSGEAEQATRKRAQKAVDRRMGFRLQNIQNCLFLAYSLIQWESITMCGGCQRSDDAARWARWINRLKAVCLALSPLPSERSSALWSMVGRSALPPRSAHGVSFGAPSVNQAASVVASPLTSSGMTDELHAGREACVMA